MEMALAGRLSAFSAASAGHWDHIGRKSKKNPAENLKAMRFNFTGLPP
jgi:hypothetical protein